MFIQQANTILVDTPGIGGSGEVTHKLKEYLPNALSFIFVINASSAGGMQKDRVKIIFMPHFIFIFQFQNIIESISLILIHKCSYLNIFYFY